MGAGETIVGVMSVYEFIASGECQISRLTPQNDMMRRPLGGEGVKCLKFLVENTDKRRNS